MSNALTRLSGCILAPEAGLAYCGAAAGLTEALGDGPNLLTLLLG